MFRGEKKAGNLLFVFLPLQKTQTRFERVSGSFTTSIGTMNKRNETNTVMASYIKTNCIMSKKERIV